MKRVRFDWIDRGSCRHPEIMTMKGGSLCSTDFPAMVGVIRHPDVGVIIFDTGYDQAFISATDSFPERFYRWATPVQIDAKDDWVSWLKQHDVPEGEIHSVILSHFHGDHVAGLRNFTDLPIYCAQSGLNRIQSGGRIRRVSQGLLAGLLPDDIDQRACFFEEMDIVDLPAAFAPFEHGRDILGDGSLVAVELPGHCPGHWGLALRTETDRYILLAADAVWSSKAIDRCVPPPRITTALLGDTRSYRSTLSLLHSAKLSNPELGILPSHCPHAARDFSDDDAD